MQVRLIGDSELSVGANVGMSGCPSLYVSPVTDWCTPPLAQCQLGWAPTPRDPLRISGLDNGDGDSL